VVVVVGKVQLLLEFLVAPAGLLVPEQIQLMSAQQELTVILPTAAVAVALTVAQ
jgi:hypothetical protein